MRLSEIETKKAAKLTELKALLDVRDQASREFTADEAARFDALEAEVEQLNTDYAREKRADDLRKQMAADKAATKQTPEDKAAKRFSIVRAVSFLAKGQSPDGIEREISQEAENELRGTGQSINGIGLPSWMVNIKGSNILGQKRDLSAGGVATGAEWVQDLEIGHQYGLEIMPKAFSLGVEVLSGLTSNVYITETGQATAVWESENATADETTPATSKPVNLSPKRLAAFTDLSKQLLIQTGSVAEERVRTQLQKAVNRKLDHTIFQGTGVAPIPYGITTTVGINTFTTGGVPDRSHFWDAWAAIVADNADVDTLGIAMTPAIYAFLANAPIDAGSGRFVLENGQINGIPVAYSNNVPDDHVIVGAFSQFVVGQWGGIDLLINPYTKGKDGLIELIVNSFWDAGCYRPLSFAVATDVTL